MTVPMRPRGPQFRPWWRGQRMRAGEEMTPYVSPTTFPAEEWASLEPSPLLGVVTADLVSIGSTVDERFTEHPVATLQYRPGDLIPPPPRPQIAGWPYGRPWGAGPTNESTAWDAALTAMHRVPTVDLSVSPHWSRSPQAAGLDLLARILSTSKFKVAGDIMGEEVAGEYTAGSVGELVPNGSGAHGWWPTRFYLSYGGAPIGGANASGYLQLQILDGNSVPSGDGFTWVSVAGERGMDAVWIDGKAVRLPRIRGVFSVSWDPTPSRAFFEKHAQFYIDAVRLAPSNDGSYGPPDELPVTLLGFPLMGQPVSGSDPGDWGKIDITAEETWAPADPA